MILWKFVPFEISRVSVGITREWVNFKKIILGVIQDVATK
jgi:hypothetical protein